MFLKPQKNLDLLINNYSSEIVRQVSFYAFITSLLSSIPYLYFGWYLISVSIVILSFVFLWVFLSKKYNKLESKYAIILSMCLMTIIVNGMVNEELFNSFFMIPTSILMFHFFDKEHRIHRIILLILVAFIFISTQVFKEFNYTLYYPKTQDKLALDLIQYFNLTICFISILYETFQLNQIKDIIIEKYKKDLLHKSSLNNLLAHDLRSPIANIEKLTKLLVKEQDPEIKEELQTMIGESATKSMTLVNDILYLSKLENTSDIYTDKIEVLGYIREACQALEYMQKSKNIKINIISTLDHIYIKAEPTMFRRVIDNIINNALKFSYEKKEIDITVEVKLTYIYITIKDYGVGMNENQIQNIFVPYSNLSTKGTSGEASVGLGMSIVKYIMDLHNFDISVKSTPQIGTEVQIKMPIYL